MKKIRIVFFAFVVLLVSCSGSGSGDSNNTGSVALQPLEITAGNAEGVFRDGFGSLEVAVSFLIALIEAYDTATPVAGPVTIMCTGGGSNTLTFNDNDTDGVISDGDSIVDTDSACIEIGTESNGTIVTTLESLTDSANGRYQGTFEFQNVVLAGSMNAAGFNGTIDFDLTISGSSVTLDALTVNSVVVGFGPPMNAFQTEIELKINSLTRLDTSLSLDVDFESEFSNGSFSITSPTTLVFNALEYPTSGVLRVIGADTDADFTGNAVSNLIASAVIRNKGGIIVATVTPGPLWSNLSAGVLINLPL